jgi:spore germination protein GerM
MSNLEKKDNDKLSKGLIILIIFIILTVIELIIFIPRVKESIDESGVKEIIEKQTNDKIANNQETLTLYYINDDGDSVEYNFETTRTYDRLHDTFENLIADPPYEVLEDFNVSYIPVGTSLIGATQTESALYVNLTENLLSSKNIELAYQMLQSTAKAIAPKANFVLLIEGEEFKLDK